MRPSTPTGYREDDHPRQGDDEDDPAPLPHGPQTGPRRLHGTQTGCERERVLVWAGIVLGCLGIVIGLLATDAKTEVLLGGVLLVSGLAGMRGAGARQSASKSPSDER